MKATDGSRYGFNYMGTTGSPYNSGNAAYFPLGGTSQDFTNGEWVRLERDLQADLTNRFGKTLSSITGIYLWSGGATSPKLWIDDVSFSNSLTVEHNTLGGGSISHILRNRSTNASTYAATDRWFHYDQVGSVMSESDAAGVLAQAHYQDAFGNTQASWSTGLWGGDKEGWHHNSKEFDNECALVYMFKRWYNPQLGRFSSSASYPVSKEHRFSFVENNPVSYADPKGQFRICCRPLAAPIAANFISHCFLVFDGPPVVTIGVYDENGQSVIHRNDPDDSPNGKNTTCGAAIPDGCIKKCIMEFIGSYFPHVYSPTTDNCNSFVRKAVEHCGQNAGDLWPSGAGSCPGGPGF